MYENRTQNNDPEIHKEYPIHDTPTSLPNNLQPCADYSTATNTILIRLKGNSFLPRL